MPDVKEVDLKVFANFIRHFARNLAEVRNTCCFIFSPRDHVTSKASNTTHPVQKKFFLQRKFNNSIICPTKQAAISSYRLERFAHFVFTGIEMAHV